MERRARTRHLIELGGLVAKSGLEEIIGTTEPDTRAVILGALMDLADELREPTPGLRSHQERIALWRERGRAALREAGTSLQTGTAAEAAVKVGRHDVSPGNDHASLSTRPRAEP